MLSFDAVPETLARTNLGRLAAGADVNLEPALRAGEPLGGHYVQGHVDAVGRTRSVEAEGDGKRIWFDAPAAVLRYVVEKGSIAVALIPHTLAATTLGALVAGDPVNLEADVLAKYVEKLVAK